MNRLAVLVILLLSFIGLSDSAYLAKHAAGSVPLRCDIQGFSDCATVAESPYSRLYGIPLADFGLIFYALLFVLAAIEIVYSRVHVRRSIQGLSALGLIASAYFMFIQLSVINALCMYCTISAAISFLIFLFAYFIEPISSRRFETRQVSTVNPRSALVLPPPFV